MTTKTQIPDGWREVTLGKLLNLVRGRSYGSDDLQENSRDSACYPEVI